MIKTSLFLAFFLSASAIAKTPDGGTPANERICDPLRDNTAGLYGLCVAYCEAQDLDLDLDNPNDISAALPNEKILRAYNRKRGAGDPQMPCVQESCPCWTREEVSYGAWGDRTDPVCLDGFAGVSGSLTGLAEGDDFGHRALVIDRPSGPICLFRDSEVPVQRVLGLDEDEAQRCASQALQTCADHGFQINP